MSIGSVVTPGREAGVAGERIERPSSGQIGTLARRGAKWSFLLIVSTRIVNVGATAVVARILAPSDFGLVAMVVALTTVVELALHMGLSWAAVEREDLSRSQTDNLFWVGGLLGAATWLGFMAAAPSIAHFYGRSELPQIILVFGAFFVIDGLTVQPLALMKRQMRFKAISLIEFSSHTFGSLVAVLLALLGSGYWALVARLLAIQSGRLVLLFTAGGYRPRLPTAGQKTLSLLKMGGYLGAYVMASSVAQSFDKVIVGKAWGAGELGYYSRAYFLMSLPAILAARSLTDVMIPALSALRNDRQRLEAAYRKALTSMAFLSCPLVLGLAVTAPESVRLIYGPQWMAIIPMVIWLAIGGVFRPIYDTIVWLFVSSGNGRALLWWGLTATSVLVAGFLVGVRWGGIGVAVSYAIVTVFFLTLPGLWLAHRLADLSLMNSLRPLGPIFGCGLFMVAVAYSAGVLCTALGVGWFWILVVKVFLGGVAYAVSSAVFIKPLPFAFLDNLKVQLLRGRAFSCFAVPRARITR